MYNLDKYNLPDDIKWFVDNNNKNVGYWDRTIEIDARAYAAITQTAV